MADPRPRSVEGTLREAAAQLGLLRAALERPRWSEIAQLLQAGDASALLEAADDEHPMSIFKVPSRLLELALELEAPAEQTLAAPVRRELRETILKAAEGLEALNPALRRRLAAEVEKSGAGRARSLPKHDALVFTQLATVAYVVALLVNFLLVDLLGYKVDGGEGFKQLAAADGELASRLAAAAGGCLLDSAAAVYGAPQCGEYYTPERTQAFSAAFAGLLRITKFGERHRVPALAAVRATVLAPEAVIVAIRRFLWRELAGQTSVTSKGGTSYFLYELVYAVGLFEEEQAALRADPRLQEAAAASLEGDLRSFLAGARMTPARLDFVAHAALCVLSCPTFTEGVRRHCTRRPDVLQLVLDTIELFIRGAPRPEALAGLVTSAPPIAAAQGVCFDALVYGFMFLSEASKWAKAGGRGAPAIDLQDLWTRGTHVLITLLRSGAAVPCSGHGTSKPLCMGPALGEMLDAATSHMAPIMKAGLTPEENWRLLVSQARQAIPMYEAVVCLSVAHLQQAAAPGCSAERQEELEESLKAAPHQAETLRRLAMNDLDVVLFNGFTEWLTEGGLTAAAASFLATAVKGVLVLAEGVGSGRVPGTTVGWSGVMNATNLAALLFVGASVALHTGPQAAAAPLSDATIKQFDGTALAVWAAIEPIKLCGTLAGTDQERTSAEFGLFVLLNTMLWWPEARAALLASEASRDTLCRAFMGVLGSVRAQALAQQPNDRWWFPFCGVLAAVPRCPAAAVALGRAGVLAQLARWAEKACVWLPHAELQRVLGLVQRIAAAAADAWRSGELRGAMQNLPQLLGGVPCLKDPTYWQRLRVTVAQPLAADAPQVGGEAEQLAAALAAAEALATRTCGNVRCTTVAGVSEVSMPRGNRCGGCRLVRYCGPACQKADWKAHKAACRELQRRKAEGGGA